MPDGSTYAGIRFALGEAPEKPEEKPVTAWEWVGRLLLLAAILAVWGVAIFLIGDLR